MMNKTEELDELVAGMYKCGYIAVFDKDNELFLKYMLGDLDELRKE